MPVSPVSFIRSIGGRHLTSRATDKVGQVETPSSGITVTIDNTQPTATLTTPSYGEIITNTTYIVSGTADDGLSGIDQVEISTNGSIDWSQVSGTTAWSYTWHIPAEDNVTHILKTRVRDKAGNLREAAPVSVTVDNVKPASIITDPINGQTLSGTTYVIRGTASDGSGITKVEISTDNGESWQKVDGTTSWNYTWTLP